MANKKTDAVDAEYQESSPDIPITDEKSVSGNVVQVQAASVALAAAMAAQKPSLLSKNMLKLYAIMSVGYLVSTLNGFGKFTGYLLMRLK